MGLCSAYLTCRSYQQAYTEGKNQCEACRGDISRHRLITEIVNRHIRRITKQANFLGDGDFANEWLIPAVLEMRQDLADEGIEVGPAEAGALFTYACLQRINELEGTIALSKR